MAIPSYVRSKFQHAEELRQHLDAGIDQGEMIYGNLYEKAAQAAADEVAPFVGRCLVENFHAAGMKDRTGETATALSKPKIYARVNGRDIVLKMFMNPEAPKREDERSPYVVAASLNYGAVRNVGSAVRDVIDSTQTHFGLKRKSLLGSAAKRSIKKWARTGKISEGRLSQLENPVFFNGTMVRKGYVVGDLKYSKLKTRSVKFSNGITVTQPHKFFELTSRQRGALGQAFLRIFKENLKKGSRS